MGYTATHSDILCHNCGHEQEYYYGFEHDYNEDTYKFDEIHCAKCGKRIYSWQEEKYGKNRKAKISIGNPILEKQLKDMAADNKLEIVVATAKDSIKREKKLLAMIDLEKNTVHWSVLYGDGYYANFTDWEGAVDFFLYRLV